MKKFHGVEIFLLSAIEPSILYRRNINMIRLEETETSSDNFNCDKKLGRNLIEIKLDEG